MLECGVDEEKIAVACSFVVPKEMESEIIGDLDNIQTRITGREPKNAFEELLCQLALQSDRFVLRAYPPERRVEVVSLIAIPGEIAEEAISEGDSVEVVILTEPPQEPPKAAKYTELGDLDHAALLSDDGTLKSQKQKSESETHISGGDKVIGDDSKIVEGRKEDDELHKAIVAGQKEKEDKTKRVVEGDQEIPAGDESVVEGKAEEEDDSEVVVKGSEEKKDDTKTKVSSKKEEQEESEVIVKAHGSDEEDEDLDVKGVQQIDENNASASEVRLLKDRVAALQSKIAELQNALKEARFSKGRVGAVDSAEDDSGDDEVVISGSGNEPKGDDTEYRIESGQQDAGDEKTVVSADKTAEN